MSWHKGQAGGKKTMARFIQLIVGVFFVLLVSSRVLDAQGMPPANVVVEELRSGTMSPQTEFIGTVYYQEISDIASEVGGLAESITFEEGKRVRKGDVLITIASDLLEKTLQAMKASHEQVLTEQTSAQRDLERAEKLHAEQLISDKTYDDYRFRALSLEKKAESLKAEVERLELELQKKNVIAPFNGVIIKKHVQRGEWIASGAAVATVARDEVFDIIVEVPEDVLAHVKPGMSVSVEAGGKTESGKVFAIIPSGDIATRTFPVKVRVHKAGSLMGGMEARVRLPSDKQQKTLLVSRDALIRKSGMTFLFSVDDSKAVMIPVDVTGYSGKNIGISSEALQEGMKIVIKGNERLMNGQPVHITGTGKMR
jgi:membrane fusion protein (multidrug efflux system)